jgi:hypothetical protein
MQEYDIKILLAYISNTEIFLLLTGKAWGRIRYVETRMWFAGVMQE